MNVKACVMLSSYNGEKYIEKQILSVLAQADVDVRLCIRDDGSSDGTVHIIRDLMKQTDRISLSEARNIGYAKSFWSLLLENDGSCDYYAFCDQDDIWDQKKLAAAISLLDRKSDIPALYVSRVVSVNNRMETLSTNCFHTRGAVNTYEIFQKSCFPGCVFVFNQKALELIRQYHGYMESHDWAVYSIVSVFGEIIYDNSSYILYRIHDQNTIGNRGRLGELQIKIKRLFNPSKHTRSHCARDFITYFGERITDKNIRNYISDIGNYRENGKSKWRLILNPRYHNLVFRIMIILNRV